jgi:hypothetical protein
MNPRSLLHLEGAAVLAVSVFAYHSDHGSWGLFALLLLGAYSVSTDHRTPLLLALIWVAHIGLDRMPGFGLKYPTEFNDTHLSARRHAYILK